MGPTPDTSNDAFNEAIAHALELAAAIIDASAALLAEAVASPAGHALTSGTISAVSGVADDAALLAANAYGLPAWCERQIRLANGSD
jgi:hypothetical protein